MADGRRAVVDVPHRDGQGDHLHCASDAYVQLRRRRRDDRPTKLRALHREHRRRAHRDVRNLQGGEVGGLNLLVDGCVLIYCLTSGLKSFR